MALHLYKSGQGYWTRVGSASAGGLITLLGGQWIWSQLETARFGDLNIRYVQAVAFLLIAVIGGLLIYRWVGLKPRTVDFLIATEGEMKKVNWSTRREVTGATWVVIGLTFFTAVFIFIWDQIFYFISARAGIIDI